MNRIGPEKMRIYIYNRLNIRLFEGNVREEGVTKWRN